MGDCVMIGIIVATGAGAIALLAFTVVFVWFAGDDKESKL